MDIDEFLDKETSKGKTDVIKSPDKQSKPVSEPDIFKQMQNMRERLQKKDIVGASEEFSTLREKYINMTKKQLQENKFLYEELMKFNNELISNLTLQQQEVQKKVILIRQLLQNAKSSLRMNKTDEANRLYGEIKSQYDDIPSVFAEDRKKINEEILTFFIQLSRFTEASARQDFYAKKATIGKQIAQAYSLLRTGNSEIIKAAFDKILTLYNDLPDGFTKEKVLLYQEILKLFSSAYLMEKGSAPSLAALMRTQEPVPANPFEKSLGFGEMLKDSGPQKQNPFASQKPSSPLNASGSNPFQKTGRANPFSKPGSSAQPSGLAGSYPFSKSSGKPQSAKPDKPNPFLKTSGGSRPAGLNPFAGPVAEGGSGDLNPSKPAQPTQSKSPENKMPSNPFSSTRLPKVAPIGNPFQKASSSNQTSAQSPAWSSEGSAPANPFSKDAGNLKKEPAKETSEETAGDSEESGGLIHARKQ